MKSIASLLVICLLSLTISAQERLTEIAYSFERPIPNFIGEFGDYLYFLDATEIDYQIKRESLLDNEISNELLGRIPNFVFHFHAAGITHSGIIVLLDDTGLLYTYNIQSESLKQYDYGHLEPIDLPVVFGDNLYIPSEGGMQVLTLENFDVLTVTYDIGSLDFYNSSNLVLIDSTMIIHDKQENTIFKLNVLTGVREIAYQMENGETLNSAIIGNNVLYLDFIGEEQGHYLLAIVYAEGNTTITSHKLELPRTYELKLIDKENVVAFKKTYGAFTRVGIHSQNIETGEYRAKSFILNDKKFVAGDPDGGYFEQDNYLIFIDFEGNSYNIRPTIPGERYDIFSPKTNFKIDNKRLFIKPQAGGSLYELIDSTQKTTLGLAPYLYRQYFEAKTENTMYLGQVNGIYQFYSIDADGIDLKTTNSSNSIKGGTFELSSKSRFPIISNRVYNSKGELYFINDDFLEVEKNPELDNVLGEFVSTNHGVYAQIGNFTDEIIGFDHGAGLKLPLQINDIESDFILEMCSGYEFIPIVIYTELSSHLRFATLDAEGKYNAFKETADYVPANSMVSTANEVYALAFDSLYNKVVIKLGKTNTETEVLYIENEKQYFAQIDIVEEGEEYSLLDINDYFNTELRFFVKNDGETRVLVADHSDPIYFNGRFYFRDKYFDEDSGFQDWDSGLDTLLHVGHGIAIGRKSGELIVLDVENLEENKVEIASSDLEFFNASANVILLDRKSNTLFWMSAEGIVEEVNLPSETQISELVGTIGNAFVFSGYSAAIGEELFVLSKEGILLTYDMNEGVRSSDPKEEYINEKYIYFSAFSSEIGRQYYRISRESLALSIEDPELSDISIFPNPANIVLHVLSEGEYDRLIIYDAMGRIVRNISTIKTNSSIDISVMNSGIYHIELHNDNTLVSRSKFVKL